EHFKTFFQFLFNTFDRHTHLLFTRNEVGCRKDCEMFPLVEHFTRQIVDFPHTVDLVAEKLYTDTLFIAGGRKYSDNIPAHTKRLALEIYIISRVLDVDKFP